MGPQARRSRSGIPRAAPGKARSRPRRGIAHCVYHGGRRELRPHRVGSASRSAGRLASKRRSNADSSSGTLGPTPTSMLVVNHARATASIVPHRTPSIHASAIDRVVRPGDDAEQDDDHRRVDEQDRRGQTDPHPRLCQLPAYVARPMNELGRSGRLVTSGLAEGLLDPPQGLGRRATPAARYQAI